MQISMCIRDKIGFNAAENLIQYLKRSIKIFAHEEK